MWMLKPHVRVSSTPMLSQNATVKKSCICFGSSCSLSLVLTVLKYSLTRIKMFFMWHLKNFFVKFFFLFFFKPNATYTKVGFIIEIKFFFCCCLIIFFKWRLTFLPITRKNKIQKTQQYFKACNVRTPSHLFIWKYSKLVLERQSLKIQRGWEILSALNNQHISRWQRGLYLVMFIYCDRCLIVSSCCLW